MNQTENYNLSQWAKTDRILMEDFNADNAKIDAALGGKLEVVELIDKTVTLDKAPSWNVPLNFNPGDYFALFIEYQLPGTSLTGFTPHKGSRTLLFDLRPPYASLALFPLRNPEAQVMFLPAGGINNGRFMYMNYQYKNMNNFSLTFASESVTLTGTYRLRVLAIP